MSPGYRSLGALMLAGAIDATAPNAAAQASLPTVAVVVDATSPGAPIERVWAFHGFDEVNYTTTPAGRSLLATLAAIHATPPHIRNHFLLNSGDGTASLKWGSTNPYSTDATGAAVYDWTLMDGVMDAIIGAGDLPLVEIGFMPHDLSVHPDPYQNSGIYVLDGGCFYPPNDYGRWASLVAAWAAHSESRYPNVGSAWQWELWNEPDTGYWHGTADEYDKLFDYTEAALHGVLPGASLGGPAVASPGAFLTQFLQHTAAGTNAVTGARGTRLDMVSFHAKGGLSMVNGAVEMSLGHQLALHRDGFSAIAAFPQYEQTPIVVSEADPDGCAACPLAQDPADAYRLSPAYGAYEIAMMKRTLELESQIGVQVRGLLTWAFLFQDQPYFAGYRVLSTNGIHLPVLGDFELLGRLDGARLPVTSSGALSLADILASGVRQQPDVDAMATLAGSAVEVLIWNYHDDLVAAPDAPITVSVRVPPSFGTRALVDHLRVDDTHGDAYTVWLAQGSPPSPSPAQLGALQQAMDPAPLQTGQPVDVVGGTISLSFDLPRFGVSLLTLTPAPASDASAASTSGALGNRITAEGGGCGCRLIPGGDSRSWPWALLAVLGSLPRLMRRNGWTRSATTPRSTRARR